MPFLFSEIVRTFSCEAKKNGYRLIACDGSDLHYPSNPAETEDVFVTKDNVRSYNLMHLNALYDVTNQRFPDAVIQRGRHEDEVGAAVQMIDRFPFDENAIFTLDRGYECYNVMAHIIERGMKFLIRVKSPDSVGMHRYDEPRPPADMTRMFHLSENRARKTEEEALNEVRMNLISA